MPRPPAPTDPGPGTAVSGLHCRAREHRHSQQALRHRTSHRPSGFPAPSRLSRQAPHQPVWALLPGGQQFPPRAPRGQNLQEQAANGGPKPHQPRTTPAEDGPRSEPPSRASPTPPRPARPGTLTPPAVQKAGPGSPGGRRAGTAAAAAHRQSSSAGEGGSPAGRGRQSPSTGPSPPTLLPTVATKVPPRRSPSWSTGASGPLLIRRTHHSPSTGHCRSASVTLSWPRKTTEAWQERPA